MRLHRQMLLCGLASGRVDPDELSAARNDTLARRSSGGAVRELLRLFTTNGVPVDRSLVELLGEDGDSEDEANCSVDDSQDESDSLKGSIDI